MRITLALLVLASASCTRDNFGAFMFDGGDGGGSTVDDGGGTTDDGSGGTDGGGGGGDLGFVCTDLFGKYGAITAVGNCNDINVNAPECISGTDVACFAHFVSAPTGMVGAVNGGAQLLPNYSFNGAQLVLGTQKRTCSGTFDPATGKLTIICGTLAEQCTVTMTRQGPTC